MIPGCIGVFLAAVVLCVSTGHHLVWALAFGLGVFYLLGRHMGFSRQALWTMAWRKGRSSLVVVPIFLLIGAVTALWRSSGTIAACLVAGLHGIRPEWFLLVAFLLTAAMSFALGSCYGVSGTAGVVLMALARSGGIDPALAAGAILSGAFFGDRCSPLSSCASLVAVATGTELYGNVRRMLLTGALPAVLSCGVYALLSPSHPIRTVDARVLQALTTRFSLGWAVWLPAVLILLLPLFHVPVKRTLAASALAAAAVSVLVQGVPVQETVRTALTGYAPDAPALAAILSGGGMASMLGTVGVVMLTSMYAGILEGIDILTPARHWAGRLADRVGLFPATVLVSAMILVVFCNQSVMVLMNEQLLGESYRKRGAPREDLALDIANSGVVMSGLVPWSISITVPLTMLDADASAIPWAVLLYFIPLCYLVTKPLFRHFAPAVQAGHFA